MAKANPKVAEGDWVQDAVIARAAELGLTAYALAKASGVSQTHVRDYLSRNKTMGSHLLQQVLRVLRLKITPEEESP